MAKEKPIICNADEVKAILDGRQNVIRRVIKNIVQMPDHLTGKGVVDCVKDWDGGPSRLDMMETGTECAPYKVGDLLWVKEGWRCTGGGTDRNIIYKAEGDTALSFCGIDDGRKSILHVPEPYWAQWDKLVYETRKSCEWRSARSMPKWAARTWLEVLDVRAERRQGESGPWVWRYEHKKVKH